MIKKDLIKKAYQKPEIEFVVFNYREVVSASDGIEDGDEDFNIEGALTSLVPKAEQGFDDTTTDNTEPIENTADGGYALSGSSTDTTATDTTTEEEEKGEGFFNSIANDVSDMVNEAKDELSNGDGYSDVGDSFNGNEGGGSENFSNIENTGEQGFSDITE